MQETGIIRRIDDLGRIVVPREIRRKLNICDGDPMELFIDGKNLVWTKYNPGKPLLQSAISLREDVTEADWLDDHAKLLEIIDKVVQILKKDRGE